MTVSIEREGDIALVVVDNPPVNALSQAVRAGLADAAEKLEADPEVRAVVLICAGRTFIAGADVTEFGKPLQPPHLPDVIKRIESSAKPWVAAIHGTALGGGFEVALGCSYRTASASAKFGLPEVNLGLIPGAGGTLRLTRKVGIEPAVEMVTGGRPVSTARALEIGAIHGVIEGDLRAGAIAIARELAGHSKPEAASESAAAAAPDPAYWDAQAARLARRARGQISPLKALEAVRNAVELDAETAMAKERAIFLELRESEQSAALRHVFFAERAAGKPPDLGAAAPREIAGAGVIGGGTMGAAIAAAFLDSGLPLVLVERDAESLERGVANIRKIYDAGVERGRITEAARATRLTALTAATDYAALAETDLVVEAVFEDLEVKQAVFAALDAACKPDAILATNTSYLDPNAIAAVLSRPENFLGLHFFSPANVMKLLEIVKAEATGPETLATAFALARRLGKIPVLAGICDGFIGNRILKTTRVQVERLLLAGAMPEEIDRAMVAFGMFMGPCATQDLSGLDIAAYQRKAARARGETPFAPVAERLCALGRFGIKTGAGWYDYADGSLKPVPSEAVAAIIAEESAEYPQNPDLTGTQRAERILFPMVNEGARILAEGIARRPSDIDLVGILGYGFPRWRGGLMHYAETRGLAAIAESLTAMADEGLADPPCDLLVKAAKAGSFTA